MKHSAHIAPDLGSRIVSVVEAQRLREKDPAAWEQRTYYSLWHLTPMCLRVRSNGTAFFAFKPGSSPHPLESGGGEGYAHELAKYILRDQGAITLCKAQRTDTIRFRGEAALEYRYDGGLYIADVQTVVDNANAFGLDAGAPLAIEIFDTHKVERVKRQYYRERNIAAIELKLPENLSGEMDIGRMKYRLERLFSGPCYFSWLHNPNWKDNYHRQTEGQ